MKKFTFFTIILILLLLSCTVSDLLAQTVIPGGYVSGIWTADGSPYLIQGDITVHSDSTLTIEPDVDVNFQGHYILTVNGELQAVGTEAGLISFVAADTVIGWKGITFFGTGIGQIEFATVQYVRSNEWGVSAIFIASTGHVTIAHSEIVNNTGYYGGGIWMEPSYGANFTISYCNISRNEAIWKGGGIYGGGVGTIEYCVISENYCTVGDYSGGAAYIYSPLNTVIFDHCTFSRNDGSIVDGIRLDSQSLMTIRNCIFEGHTNVAISASADSIVTYCDFYNNGVDIYPSPPGFGDLVEVNANGDSCDVFYNLFLDPMFADAENGDFHLQEDSPCIDAGNPESPCDPDSTICDMGALYYDQSVGIEDRFDLIPERITLSQNYPNPFNAFTLIKYKLPRQTQVAINIYDILGHKVNTLLNQQQQAGYHQVVWNAENFSSGMYFYKLQAGDYIETKKMMLLK